MTWKAEKVSSTQEAATALYERIQRYFEEDAPREQSIKVNLDAGQNQPESEGQEAYRTLYFSLPDGTQFKGYCRVSNVGGNMYEIDAGVEDRSETFEISLPEASAAAEDNYSRPVCDYLLEEIKRAAGEIHLRDSSPH